MIAEKADVAIEQAVAYELQNIVKNHGAVYASKHEAYAVLLEEVEEAQEALDGMRNNLETIWRQIRTNNTKSFDVYLCKESAIGLSEEAVQCAAVCERFIETIKKEEENGMA